MTRRMDSGTLVAAQNALTRRLGAMTPDRAKSWALADVLKRLDEAYEADREAMERRLERMRVRSVDLGEG